MKATPEQELWFKGYDTGYDVGRAEGRDRWAIAAQVEFVMGEWHTSRQVPMFYLNDRQASTILEAEKLARQVVDPVGVLTVHLSIVDMSVVQSDLPTTR